MWHWKCHVVDEALYPNAQGLPVVSAIAAASASPTEPRAAERAFYRYIIILDWRDIQPNTPCTTTCNTNYTGHTLQTMYTQWWPRTANGRRTKQKSRKRETWCTFQSWAHLRLSSWAYQAFWQENNLQKPIRSVHDGLQLRADTSSVNFDELDPSTCSVNLLRPLDHTIPHTRLSANWIWQQISVQILWNPSHLFGNEEPQENEVLSSD